MRISDVSSDVCSSDMHFFCCDDRLVFISNGIVPSRTTAFRKVLIPADMLMPISSKTSVARLLTSWSMRIVVVGLIDMSSPIFDRPSPSQSEIQCSTRSEEHTSELQSLMRISYAVFCLHKKTN